MPSPLLYAAAGRTGMALWRFMLLDLIGALAYAGLGYAIGHPAAAVVSSVTHYALAVTVALIVVTVAIWRQGRHSEVLAAADR